MQCPRSDSDHANAQSSVHKGVVKISALKWRHAAILASLPVENEVDTQQRGPKDACSVDKSLAQVTLRGGVVGSLLIRAAEGLAELGDILRRRDRGCFVGEEVRVLLEWRVVEGADGDALRPSWAGLLQRCRYRERPPEEKRHGVLCCY